MPEAPDASIRDLYADIQWLAVRSRYIALALARDFGLQPSIPHAERLALSGAVSIARR